MTHSEYTAYGRNLATRHKSILHAEGTSMHFARIIISRDPMGGDNIQEFILSLKNNIRFPFVLWEAYDHNYHDNKGDNIQKLYQGAFIILMNPIELKSQAGNNIFKAEELAIDQAEKIGEDFISYMKKDFAEKLPSRYLNISDISSEKVGPVASNFIGVRFNFSFAKTANQALNFNPDNWISE